MNSGISPDKFVRAISNDSLFEICNDQTVIVTAVQSIALSSANLELGSQDDNDQTHSDENNIFGGVSVPNNTKFNPTSMRDVSSYVIMKLVSINVISLHEDMIHLRQSRYCFLLMALNNLLSLEWLQWFATANIKILAQRIFRQLQK